MAAARNTKKGKSKRLRPLAPAPLRSLKRARQVTTAFHRLSRQMVAAEAKGDKEEVARLKEQLDLAGGREAYQRASQVSTAVHSTSRWVLAFLASSKADYRIHGIPPATEDCRKRRPTRLLEVGAINTELLDAAERSHGKLVTRAIDLQSSHPAIEELDFLQLPFKEDERYDVVVCSMVLNCVNTAEERGRMLCRLFHFTAIDGLVFLTIPKSCLTMSRFMDEASFIELLQTIGFVLVESKLSPRLAFFILRRGDDARDESKPISGMLAAWTTVRTLHRGKNLKNDFSVVLDERSVLGLDL